MAEVQFLFDNQLIASLETLIKESKNQLLLVSPFIDLDRRIQDALKEKLNKHDFELHILFGKNEDKLYKSIKKDSLDFLKHFPNIEIRYNDRLHAKFYQNDFDYIMASLNLYDYSLAKNIEVGIKGTYASKGLVGKVLDGTGNILSQGVDLVNQNVFGFGKDVNPIEKFQSIFLDSELKYKSEPIVVDKSGIQGAFGAKKLNGTNVILDKLKDLYETNVAGIKKNTISEQSETNIPASSLNKQISKTLSASQLSKSLGISSTEITKLMQKAGLIDGDKITPAGEAKGLVRKNYMGNDYIAYPENLDVIKSILQ